MEKLKFLLEVSAARHHQLCPRQVLGVRMGLLAGKVLKLDLPQTVKRLFTFVECDGCGMGGIVVATGCSMERRTMQVLDYGKLAGTFVDTHTGRAIRIHPHPNCRDIAQKTHPDNLESWHVQLEAYQTLADSLLFVVESIQLAVSMESIISQPNLRVCCTHCGEEIMNERQVIVDKKPVCRICCGKSYFIRQQDTPATADNHHRQFRGMENDVARKGS